MERTEAIEGLDDADLLVAARQWRLWTFGRSTRLYAGVLLPSFVTVVTLILADPNWAALGVFVGTSLVASALLSAVETRLQRRDGPNLWERELRRRVGSSTGLFFERKALPHGNSRVVWIDLDRRRLICLEEAPDCEDTNRTKPLDTALSDDETAVFMAAIREVADPTDSNQRFEVMDGIPFDLTIHGTESIKLTGNLAADGRQYGGWRLARLIEVAVQRRGANSSWYGATDALTGSVTIGRT